MKTYQNPVPEISLKFTNRADIERKKINCAQDFADFMRLVFDADTLEVYESMFCIFLNRSNETIGFLKVSQGGIVGTVCDNKLILKVAINCLASGICLAHNHPSGALEPSEADKNITRKLKEACTILDINLLDHIILTPNGFSSFTINGWM